MRAIVGLLVMGLVVAGGQAPGASSQHADVEFTECIESIGVGLVATEAVRALVPTGFALAGDGQPVTPLVVRTADCAAISVEGHQGRAGTIVQVGAVIVPPDFTGDINNYTILYYTSDAGLAILLNLAGVQAQYVPNLSDDYHAGQLHVRVPRPGHPVLSVDGQVVASNVPAGSFRANWWQSARHGVVKMDTNVPVIAIGTANLVLTTTPHGPLGELIGGDSIGFPILQQFNVFSNAHMEVSRVQ
jgi:hypothetical protein